jgi:hypothetical protein
MRRLERVSPIPLNKESMLSLTQGIKDLVKGRFAPQILKEERLRICQTCPYGGMRCDLCGCFVKGKIALLNSSCPLDKWPSMNPSVNTTQHQDAGE